MIAEAAATQRLAIDLETGLRGYLISGDESFLQPTRRAQQRIAAQGRTLARLVNGDRAQARRVARLEQRLQGLDIDFRGFDSFADLQGGVEAARR